MYFKSFTKRILLIAWLIPAFYTATLPVYGQARLSIQGASVFPAGELQDAADVGFGGSFTFTFPVYFSNLEAALSAGYYLCGYKENLPDYQFSFSSLPVAAGLRWNFTDVDFIPFAGVYAAGFFHEYNLEIDDKIFGIYRAKTKDTHWGIVSEAGLRMNLHPAFDIEVSARYNHLKNKYIARSFLFIQTGLDYRF